MFAAAYLNKRAQVVFQSLLVAFGNYMYDHTEGTEHGNSIYVLLSGVKAVKVQRICFLADRKELTAISWASLVAAVSTSNSCISTVGRKVMMTWVSMACRHWGKEARQDHFYFWLPDIYKNRDYTPPHNIYIYIALILKNCSLLDIKSALGIILSDKKYMWKSVLICSWISVLDVMKFPVRHCWHISFIFTA